MTVRFAPESLGLFVSLLNQAHIMVGPNVLLFEAQSTGRGTAQISVTELEVE